MRPEVQDELVDALRALDEREKFVIGSLFVERLSFRDIGRRMGVDPRTVQRVKAKALEKLKTAISTPEDELMESDTSGDTADRIPKAKPAPMFVRWATCRRCMGEGVSLDADDLCGICAPIVSATEHATSMRQHGRRRW